MKDKVIKVLKVEPKKAPEICLLKNELESLQEAVSVGADYTGLIEIINLDTMITNISICVTPKKLLDLACFYEKNGYDYKLLIAIYYFFEGNIRTALSHIEECKNITNDKGWKFSKVFLKLYQQDSFTNFMNAYKTYNSIFGKPMYTFEYISNISEFIHRVLEKEPKKKQLNFLLFLIYHYLENIEEEKKYYNEFINAYPELIEKKNFIEILIKLGKVEEKESIAS